MKLPVFGFNKLQSFIDFFTTFGKMRVGLEGLRVFAEVDDKKLQIDGKLLNQTFEGTISLGQGLTHYNDFTVDAALEIALEANPIIGGSAEIRLIGDGATTPTFSADFTVGVASTAYDNTLNAINKVIFYYDGSDALYSITTGDSIFGSNPTPVARTNNPIVGANSVNANIDLLDAAIGADPTPAGTRTAGTIAVANTANQNIDALDAAIGFEAQMSGTPHVVTKSGTVFQMLDQIDTYKSVQTIKKTIGGVGVAGCDFNFATAENQTEQIIDLGALLPAKARLVDIFLFTDDVFTGAISLAADVGLSSGGDELIASASIYADDAIIAAANAGAFIATPAATVQNIYVNATPGANWNLVTAGKVSVYLTFINVTNI